MTAEAQWYLILVPDAFSVLQVFQEKDIGVFATVQCLLNWGIPFNTVRYIEKRPRNILFLKKRMMDNKNMGLGYRNKDHHFDPQEYAIYEKRKQDILKKGHRQAA